MTKEYKNLHIKAMRPESVEELLNSYSKDGWRVVNQVQDRYHDQVWHDVKYLVLERDKAENIDWVVPA